MRYCETAGPIRPVSWRISGGRHVGPAPFLVAGIVNVTPDSFSDGGSFFTPEAALLRVRRVVAEGADIVDLGAESTRPGAEDIGPQEEWRRLGPVLEGTLALRAGLAASSAADEGGLCPPFAVSIDSFRAGTAALALALGSAGAESGADIINDVSGGAFDPAMADVLAEFKPGYVLGHSPARPQTMWRHPRYENVVDDLLDWFSTRMTALVKAGLPEECICLDPCIGFGKTLDHALDIFAAVPRFAALGRPLYFGISRKSFFAALFERFAGETPAPAYGGGHDPPSSRQGGETLAAHAACSALDPSDMRRRELATQAAVALLAAKGVSVHRVHRVADTVTTLAVVRAMARSFAEAGA